METVDQGADRRSAARLARLALSLILLGGTLIVVAYDWLGIGAANLEFTINGPIYDAVVIASGLACLLLARGAGRERSAWLLIGLAILSWGAGEIYWTAFIVENAHAPYPSPADAGYLAFYPLAAAGLVLLVRAKAEELDWRLWMDGLIAALGTAALGTAFVFNFVADHTSGTSLQKVTTLAYPIGDIAILSLVVGAIALTRWRPGRTWWLLLAGLSALVVADIAYTLQSAGSLPSGEWIDPIYLIAAICLGAEMWQPRAAAIRPSARFDGWRELMIPALFFAVMIGLFSMQYFGTTGGLSTILWAATMLAVVIRLGMSVRENKALLEQVRTDSLTGLGNRGRMEMDLRASCERASESEPIALVLLDLNEFKRYNDTFGHPEGDSLLIEAGRSLREAVGGDGSAYRIGGDEFCVLLTCAPERFAEIAERAAAALNARRSGVTVSPSFGIAVVPSEAGDRSAALRLADVRMYAQKESRRVSLDPDPEEIQIDALAERGG